MATLTGMATGVITRFSQYKNRMYGWNGRNRMRKFDGDAYNLAGIEKSNFIPIVATSGTGLTGKFRYYVVPINTKHLTPLGLPVSGIPSLLSSEIICNNQGVSISGIPATHPDPQVNKWYIYRNRAGIYKASVESESQDFFFLAEIAIGTTSYVDTLDDTNLAGVDRIRQNQQIPATFKFGAFYGERLFGTGYDPITAGTATKSTKTVTTKEITSNIAKLTTSAAHGYVAGNWVTVSISDIAFDGTFQILDAPTTTTFRYYKRNADIASGAGSGSTEVINFSTALPDGVVGCLFKKTDDTQLYRIIGINSTTQVAMSRISGFGVFNGTLSASTFSVFRYPWEIYFSEFTDPEAWGPDGEGFRWKREVPGHGVCTGIVPYRGQLLVFTPSNIYAISGKGPNPNDIIITPEPVWKGLGAVQGDAIVAVDDEIYFMSLRGPCKIAGGPPELIGLELRTDWLDSLTQAEQALCCVGTDGYNVYFSFPESGNTENSREWRYERYNQSWWEEKYKHALFYFLDDGDNGVQDGQYYVQGKQIIQPNKGTLDLVTAALTGTVTTGGTLGFTASAATLPTTGAGLQECYVHVFRAGAFVGSRRIATNTATAVTWAASGAGGGSLTVAIGDTFEIGKVWWTWKTRTYEIPAQIKRDLTMFMSFGTAGSSNIQKTDFVNGVQVGNISALMPNNELTKTFDVNMRNNDYACKVESRDGLTLRQIMLQGLPKVDKG